MANKPKVAEPTWTTEVKDAFAVLCYGSADAWKLKRNAGRMVVALKELSEVKPVTIEALRVFYSWWKRCDFRGQKDQKPTPQQVVETWIQAQTGACGDTQEKIFIQPALPAPDIEPWALLNGNEPPGWFAEVKQ